MERIKEILEPVRMAATHGERPEREKVEASATIRYPIKYTQTQVHVPPDSVLQHHRILSPGSDRHTLHAYKLLRTQVLQRMKANKWNSMAVLAGRSREGATLTAINLAISIALDPRHTVLLVDMNLRSPSIHDYFGYTPSVGVTDVMAGRAGVSDALFNPGIDSLAILPGVESIVHSAELLASQGMHDLITDLKSRYQGRVIIFDLPPLLEADDAIAFMPHFDAGLLVLSDGKSRRADILTVGELLGTKPLIGSVLNDKKS